MLIRIFLRQCFTETTDPKIQELVQEVFNALTAAAKKFTSEHPDISFEFGPGVLATTAKWEGDFRQKFTEETGQEFNAKNFNSWRRNFLAQADIFVSVRTSLSESTAVELSSFIEQHTADGWERCFIVKADLSEAEIKTTLLKQAEIIPFAVENHKVLNPEELETEILTKVFHPELIAKIVSEKEAKAVQLQVVTPMASCLMPERKSVAVQTDCPYS